MNNNLLKHISEYFNTFPKEDYTIYVNGTPTKWCTLNNNNCSVVYKLSDNSSVPGGVIYDKEWYIIYDWEIEAIKLTPTTMELIKTNGKEYIFSAKIKRKEDKVKEIILKTKNSLYACHVSDAIGYLDELKVLMDE